MAKRIAINGFGRIGRVALRILHERKKRGESDVVVHAINDLADLESMAYLLKYDSVHGRFPWDIRIEGNTLVVDGSPIQVTSERAPEKLPWKAFGIDVVFESTGLFASREKAALHLEAGAKKVLVSAPCSEKSPADATICYGVNHQAFRPEMQVISTASCTTNCIAPVAKILHDHFGIQKAFVTTIHSYTNDQHVLDLFHKDKRRSRAAAVSMIPTTTGAAQAVAQVLPELEGKFDGMAVRVPTPNVSCIDLVAILDKNATASEINVALKTGADGKFKGVLGYTTDPVVSVDMNGTNESSIVDALSTRALGGNFIKVISWYDNEWGFGNRAVDVARMLAQAC